MTVARSVFAGVVGADPWDLPVEQIDRLYLIINFKTAKLLGLTIPKSMLARADKSLSR